MQDARVSINNYAETPPSVYMIYFELNRSGSFLGPTVE